MSNLESYTLRAARRMRPPDKAALQALRQAANRPETSQQRISDTANARLASRRAQPSRRAVLPELAPADSGTSEAKSFVGLDMSSKAVVDEETRFSRRSETTNETAKLTVYVLNAILLIMAFPVGFGMLVFNILGGENVRTTAHVIALTGLAIALSGGTFGSEFLFSA